MSTLLQERAEDFDYKTIKEIESTSEAFSLKEYLFSEEKRPCFLLGPKGTGKTFKVRKTLSELVKKKKHFIPVMYVLKDANSMELLDPTKLATEEVWGDRLKILNSKDQKELLSSSDVIVVDDIHRTCEAIAKGKYDPNVFMSFLKEMLNYVSLGKKVILISEDPISYYTERLNMKELDELLLKFGLLPREPSSHEEWEDFNNKRDYQAFKEVLPPHFSEWKHLFKVYKVDADVYTKNLLYNLNPKPRAFIKFMKIFQPKDEISIQDVNEKILELLKGKVSKKELKFYEFLTKMSVMEIPEFSYGKNMKWFIDTLNRVKGYDNLFELQRLLPVIENVCEKSAESLRPGYGLDHIRFRNDPKYALKMKAKEDPIEVQKVLQKVISDIVPEEDRSTVNNLVKIYYSNFDLENQDISKANQALKTLRDYAEKALCGSLKKQYPKLLDCYFNRMIKNLSELYIQRETRETYYLLLNKPFQIAFSDLLTETPTLKILSKSTR